jgi:peptidylprolyl isomerase domain and WD repeat-containing protein 1
MESKERFLRICLAQVPIQGDKFSLDNETCFSPFNRISRQDPTIFAIAYRKIRFYLFTRHEPEELIDNSIGRDVFNEKTINEATSIIQSSLTRKLSNSVTLHTSRGEIWLQLYPDHCPLAVENLITHAKNGYYNGIIFHRVIKGFMIQTGDPLGNGSGGQSIWGAEFKDEIVKSLRNDRAGTVSMANTGPNSNGSQFFITTTVCPWLDGKHTVFGRVINGMDVVQAIANAKVDRNDKPIDAIKILNIEVKEYHE